MEIDDDFPWVTIEKATQILAEKGVKVFNPHTKTWNAPSEQAVRKWCAEKRLKSRRKGWIYLVHRASLESFTPNPPGRPLKMNRKPSSKKRGRPRRRPPHGNEQ